MRYGFIIDQRKCIGCHACTVACKQENGVALGNFRTWVKYTEKGTFPNVTRNFLVERCNHCDDAPCVTICPVTALWKRDDGIVDFSGDRCIGCKSCMAACPYDAIYIDPDTHTIGKCNYCAHRVDVGLQPACVNVCPVEAIITGDLDNPNSRISQLLSLEPAVVRRPEKGTKPKLFYLGADDAAVNPEATSERANVHVGRVGPGEADPDHRCDRLRAVRDGAARLRRESPAALGLACGRLSLDQVDRCRRVPGGGIPLPPGRHLRPHSLLTVVAPIVALIFLGVTNVLLVLDLERPGTLLAGDALAALVLLAGHRRLHSGGLRRIRRADAAVAALAGAAALHRILLWPASLLAVGAAAYTAFLLAQAKGRDLWQSPLLPAHLVVQAALAGSAALAILAVPLDSGAVRPLAIVLATSLGLQRAARPDRATHTACHRPYAAGHTQHGRWPVRPVVLERAPCRWCASRRAGRAGRRWCDQLGCLCCRRSCPCRSGGLRRPLRGCRPVGAAELASEMENNRVRYRSTSSYGETRRQVC